MTTSKLQKRGPGARKIELEERLDRNAELIDRTRQALPSTRTMARTIGADSQPRR